MIGSVCPFVTTIIASIIKVSGRWENCTINCMFPSVTPIDHTQLCHVLPQPCMLQLSVGKGRQVRILAGRPVIHGCNCFCSSVALLASPFTREEGSGQLFCEHNIMVIGMLNACTCL